MKYTVFLIAVLTLISCHSNKHATGEDTTTSTDAPDRFCVSFISIGAGTDTKSKKQFDEFLAAYQHKNKVKLNYEIKNWGREGEVDYCFPLTGLSSKKQGQFITDTKELLKNSTLVRYKEN